MFTSHSAGGVVIGPQGRVLVVNQNSDSWSLPKGHIESGETPLQAAIREIQEESGVKQLEFVKELGDYERYRIAWNGGDDVAHLKKITMFLFKTSQSKLLPNDAHNPEARWIIPKEVSSLLTHRKDQEFFNKVLSDINQLLLQ